METLLTVAVILITVAVIVQAGVLIGMYLLSRRVTNNVDSLISESRRLTEPLEAVTRNLKSVSEDLTHLAKTARSQVQQIQELIIETRETVFVQVTDMKDQIMRSFEEAKQTVMRPVRQWSAIAQGVAEGVRTFFSRKPGIEKEIELQEPEYPAA